MYFGQEILTNITSGLLGGKKASKCIQYGPFIPLLRVFYGLSLTKLRIIESQKTIVPSVVTVTLHFK